jgi:hypothetical protein
MHILQPVSTSQTITIIPRDYVFSLEDLDLYFERVLLDGGTLEAQSCVRQDLSDLDGVTLYLVNENTNTTATINPSIIESNGFMSLSAEFSLVAGTFYGLKIFKGSNLIYRDRVFVTSQTEYDKFTVNQNVYTQEQSYNNEFIVL